MKVALSGEGSDELFGGYYTYVADLLAGALRRRSQRRPGRSPTCCRPRRGRRASTTRRSASRALPACRRSSVITAGRRSSPPTRAPSSPGAQSMLDPLAEHRARFAETEGHELLTRLQDLDFGLYLVDDLLTKTDRASMAWSLEARVPFMDTVVANFAFSLPAKHKVRGLSKKRLLRQGGRAAAAARGRARPQARLLDPGGGLAARRPRAVRARDALGGHAAPAGLLPARGGHARARRARRRPRRSLAPAVGPARVHALARASRRRHQARRAARGGASHEGLVRLHRERAPARVPAARRAPPRAGPRGRDHGTRLRADAAADRVARDDGDGDRASRRPVGAREVRAAAVAAEGAAAVGEGPRLRPRTRARLTRADDDGAPPRHPERDDVRLRVGVAPAPARLQGGDAGRRPRRDPARAAREVHRGAAEAPPVPGA